jgi:hypothetical protein
MEVIDFKKVTTRKSHNCWGCLGKIPKGTIIQRTVTIDSGKATTAYWCDVCCKKIDKIGDDGEGFEQGALRYYDSNGNQI